MDETPRGCRVAIAPEPADPHCVAAAMERMWDCVKERGEPDSDRALDASDHECGRAAVAPIWDCEGEGAR